MVLPCGTQPMLLPELSCVFIPSFRSVAPRVFLAEILFLALLVTMVTFFQIFMPMFKSGHNLRACQISEKSTHCFGQNDGTNIQADRQTSPFICVYISCVCLCSFLQSCLH